MDHAPHFIGAQVVSSIYLVKHKRRMPMSRFAFPVGSVDALVIMAELATKAPGDVFRNPAALQLLVEIVETLDEDLTGVLDRIASGMLVTRARFDELLARGDITPAELLMLIRGTLCEGM